MRSRYSVAKPSSLIDPRSPPDPFTQSTRTGRPVSGSSPSSLADVLPPPKFVTVRSAPNKVERYSNNSGGLFEAASVSDQRPNGILNGSALRVSGAISNRSLINSGSLFFIRGAPIHSLCNQSSGRLQSEAIILHQAGAIRWHTGNQAGAHPPPRRGYRNAGYAGRIL